MDANSTTNKSELHGQVTSGPEATTLAAAFRHVIATGRHDVTALITHNKTLAFTELDRRSDHVARMLQAEMRKKAKPPRACIVAMEPSVERVIALLALLKINLPYVPVEACVAKNRLKLIIREIRPLIILTCQNLANKFASYDVYTEGANGIILFEDLRETPDDIEEGNIADENPAAVACILYTSGSTGVPKGVMLTHGNIMARLAWQWRRFPFEGEEVGIAKTSLLFVDSISELWSFLLQGRPVVIVDQETVRNLELFVKLLSERRVSRLVLVPSLLEALLKYSKSLKQTSALSELKEIVCSGERLSPSLVKLFFSTFDEKCLMNFYGSTEVTGDATYDVFKDMKAVEESTSDGSLSIGIPIDNVVVRLVDNEGNVVVDGEIGEIIVSGPTVMAGYFKGQPGDIASGWYHTGDYGRVVNGKIVYMGRKDDQIKIRGHRVNIEEIQRVISDVLPETKIVVLVIDPESVAAQIVAFIGAEPDTTKNVEEACRESLPPHAIPKLHFLPEIPMSESTGKVDRIKLGEIFRNSTMGTKCNDQPCDPIAQMLLLVVGNELGIEPERIKLDHEFSAIGGNSVNKVFIASALRERGLDFVFQDFLIAKTIGDLITCLLTKEKETLPCVNKFCIVLAEETQHEFIEELVLTSFAERDPFLNGCGLTREDGDFLNKAVFETATKNNGVFAIIDNNNGEIVGAVVLYDPATFVLPDDVALPQSLQMFFEVLTHTEKLMEGLIAEGERLMEYMALVTIPTLTVEEKLAVVRQAEQYAIDVATERGFAAMVSSNSNPVTQAIATELGYVTKGTTVLCEYQRPDGSRPLAHVTPDAKILSQIKFLK